MGLICDCCYSSRSLGIPWIVESPSWGVIPGRRSGGLNSHSQYRDLRGTLSLHRDIYRQPQFSRLAIARNLSLDRICQASNVVRKQDENASMSGSIKPSNVSTKPFYPMLGSLWIYYSICVFCISAWDGYQVKCIQAPWPPPPGCALSQPKVQHFRRGYRTFPSGIAGDHRIVVVRE